MKRRFYLLLLLVGLCLGIFSFQHFQTPQPPSAPTAPHAEETPSTPSEPSATSTPSSTPSEPTESTPDQKTDVRTPPPSTPAPAQPAKPQSKKLVIYLEKSLIPKAWLEEWNKGITVEQRLLSPGQEAPTDGDLYAISPRVFNELRGKIDFAKYESTSGLEGVNPAFLGQGFDLDSEWTRPWRWTPYFIYYRNPPAKTAVPPNLWKSANAIFTTDIDWLVALRMKEEGRSANLIKSSNWGQTLEAVEKDVNGHTATEEECWQSIRDGKSQVSFLPASMRLRPPIEDPANLSWFAPAKGTLAQFDLLVIPRNSQAPDAALSLVKFLLQPAQQDKLMPETGYFAVKTETGKETRATIPVPTGAWLGSTEFLLKPSVESIAKAVPVERPADTYKKP